MRIKYSVLDNIFEENRKKHINPSEMKLLLFLVCRQSADGSVRGLRCRGINQETGIHYFQVYTAIKSLSERELIWYERDKCDYGKWDLGVIKNSFDVNKDDNYLDIDISILKDIKSANLSVGEQLLYLQFLKCLKYNGIESAYKVNRKAFYCKYAAFLNVKEDTLQKYIWHLRHFFDIRLRNKMYEIRLLSKIEPGKT